MLAGHWQNLKVARIHADKTQDIAESWARLAASALEPAGFNCPQWISAVGPTIFRVKVTTVSDGPDLVMALPLVEKGTHFSSASSPLLASGLPHVLKTSAQSAIMAFINAHAKPILLRGIPANGAFADTLKRNAAHFATLEQWQRAALKPSGSFDEWLATNFDQKRRKEFKRLRNRLGEQGVLTTEILKSGADSKPFADDFLRLEAAGWKGKKGTAINAMPELAESFYEATANLHRVGKLRFWSLKLDGKSIASLYAIVEGPHAWLGKIAYDESYAKFSPGVMIIFDCTESFFAEPKITQIDSCAIPNHPMIDRIWRDRLSMVSVFAAPATISAARFKLVVGLEKLRLHSRSKLRDIYYKMRGAKRS